MTWRSEGALKASSVEFIDENGSGPGARLRKGPRASTNRRGIFA